MRVKGTDKMVRVMKSDSYILNQTKISHSNLIMKFETEVGKIPTQLNARPKEGRPS